MNDLNRAAPSQNFFLPDWKTLRQTLESRQQQRARLAALGEAVTKINHDLRNILSSAEIVADRREPQPLWDSLEYKVAWLTAMADRLPLRHQPTYVDRREFLHTVRYEAQRAGLEPELVLLGTGSRQHREDLVLPDLARRDRRPDREHARAPFRCRGHAPILVAMSPARGTHEVAVEQDATSEHERDQDEAQQPHG